ncbi:MAG: glycosyltransferase [Nocardioidaceae bacterium]
MNGTEPRVSVVIPAYAEGATIRPVLDRLCASMPLPSEVLVVVDFPEDSTLLELEDCAGAEPPVRGLVNDYGPGPACAIRYGIDHAAAPVVVVAMADGCDDPVQIAALSAMVEQGVVVAAASRYMPGGRQVGGPLVKRLLSGTAGRTLFWFARIGIHDATNSFKAYDRDFVARVGIDSRAGFAIGLELTAKARRLRLPVAEIPTTWLDRQAGTSNFKVVRWLPAYLRWYFYAFGPRIATSAPDRPADAWAARS